MPWQELSPVDLRMHFVSEWDTGVWTMTELCAQYQVSRKTGYKWLERREEAGAGGLHDRSRRPTVSPRATPAAVVEAIVAVRRQHPTWGGRKVRAWLRRHAPSQDWPQRTTVCDVLKRRGLTRARRTRGGVVAAATRLAPVTGPNDTWTADFKGEFRTGDATLCFPFTLRDAFSRVVLRCDALPGVHYQPTRARFARAFATYGLPTRIRTDNGGPFASPAMAGLSRLAVWWIRLGITPERITPGRPQQNGAHEQFHSVLRAETARPPAATLAAQQRRFAAFCHEYNTDRPHEALGDLPPALLYGPSARPLPRELPPLTYPGHFEVRRVGSNGCISWKHRAIFMTEVLAGEDLGLEAVDDGVWTLHVGHVIVGRFDERTGSRYELAPG